MNKALASVTAPLSWLRSRMTPVVQRKIPGLSLVASWLQSALWLIELRWLSLVTKAYGQNAVVYACLRLLCQSIAEARLKAYQEDSDGTRTELARDHALVQLLRHPNELMTEFEMLELVTIHLAVVGRSVWWKERANDGTPIALWPLRPDRVGPIYSPPDAPTGERVLMGWAYRDPSTGNPIGIARRDCIAFNFPDPTGETGGIVEGFGPIAAIAREVAADNKATEHVGAILANYGQPGIVLEIEESLDEDQAKLIKAKFRQEFGGVNVGTPSIVDARTKVTPLGFNLRELEFPDVRSNAEARMCAAVGTPPILVGVKAGLDRSTYSNTAEARQFFAETTCSAYWRRYSDQFTLDLAVEFGDDLLCDFDTSKVRALAGQQAEKLGPIKEGFSSGVVTVDEYRAALNYDPLPDGLGGVVRFANNLTELPVTKEAIAAAEKRKAEAEQKAAEQAKQQAEQQAKVAKEQGAVANNEPEGGQNATVATDEPPATGGNRTSPPGAGGARAGQPKGNSPAARSLDPALLSPVCNGAATKALDDRTTAWLGLYLPADVADRLAIPDGESPEALHMTVAYLGQQPAEVLDALPNTVAEWAYQNGPIDCTVSGIGRFNPDATGQEAVYCSIDSPGLPEWRESLLRHLAAHGLVPDKAHGFTPHVTLAYVPQGAETPITLINPLAFTLDKLSLSRGDVRRDYILAGPAAKFNPQHVSTIAETKSVDPRDAAERRLAKALESLFEGWLDDVVERLQQGQMPSTAEMEKAMRRMLEPQLAEIAADESQRIATDLGVEFDAAIANAEAAKWARQYSYDLVKGITETTRDQLRDALGKFHETSGMTRAQLEGLIAPAFGKQRAALIATTEVTRSYNEAMRQTQETLTAAGVKSRRIWRAIGDDAVCQFCGPMDGVPQAKWPTEAKDGPPLHPACRCGSVIETIGDPDAA